MALNSWDTHNGSEDPKNIEMCKNVTNCKPGHKCFFGKCKKYDFKCDGVTCQPNFRCSRGLCVEQ